MQLRGERPAVQQLDSSCSCRGAAGSSGAGGGGRAFPPGGVRSPRC